MKDLSQIIEKEIERVVAFGGASKKGNLVLSIRVQGGETVLQKLANRIAGAVTDYVKTASIRQIQEFILQLVEK